MNESDSKYIIQSVDKALAILDLFCNHEALSATEIAALTGNGKSTTFRMLATLEGRNYIHRDNSGKYQAGFKLILLGPNHGTNNWLINFVHPYISRISKATGETVHFAIQENEHEIKYIDVVFGNSVVTSSSSVGFLRELYSTASGKVILSCKSDEAIKNYVDSIVFHEQTPFALKSKEEVYAAIEAARKFGYAANHDMWEIGLGSFAAPVKLPSGQVIGAVSLSGPTTRFLLNADRYTGILMSVAKEMSKALSDDL